MSKKSSKQKIKHKSKSNFLRPKTKNTTPVVQDQNKYSTISKEKSLLGDNLDKFVKHLESLFRSVKLVMHIVEVTIKSTNIELDTFLKKHAKSEKEDSGSISYLINIENLAEAERKFRDAETASLSVKILPRSFLVTLVSLYDSYLYKLIFTIYSLKPELLNISEKQIQYSKLSEFTSIESARDYLIEKEVESVLRKNHAEQFKWLEKIISIPLRDGLDIWSEFIEITERRNLFVHCDGIVSTQYIEMCKIHGADLDKKCAAGDELTVKPDYFSSAYNCIFEIGVKLSHVIWRKLLPDDRKKADRNLLLIIYHLLFYGHYSLAKTLSVFATNEIKKYSSDEIRRMFIINKAIAHKWQDDEKGCKEIIESEDWGACNDKFKIAIAVLSDNFSTATKIMHRVGNSGLIRKSDYRDWPLFNKFRKSSEFQEAYKKIFNESFMDFENYEDSLKNSEEDAVKN
ncbi:MAG: hypothetical protein AB1461_14200 [Thermodesulfobacteriota bacterium]